MEKTRLHETLRQTHAVGQVAYIYAKANGSVRLTVDVSADESGKLPSLYDLRVILIPTDVMDER